MYVHVSVCVCIAGTHLTIAVFIMQSMTEVDEDNVTMLITWGLPVAVSIITKNYVKSYRLHQTAKPNHR